MKTSALILAGGKSSRMNYVDKATLPFKDETFLTIIYQHLKEHVTQVIISEGKQTHREYHKEVKQADFVRDVYEDCGPIGGLYTGLRDSEEEYQCVAACDMPNLDYALYEHLLSFDQEEYDAIIPTVQERIQPLAGIYKKRILSVVKEQLEKGNHTMKDLLKLLHVKYVEVSEDEALSHMLQNINTLEEYKEIIN